jgi:DnaJ family protein C protein 11
MVSVDEDEDVQFHIPSPRLNAYGVSYSFSTPVLLPRVWSTAEDETETSGTETGSGENAQEEEEPENMLVTFNAGITGGLARQVKKVQIEYEDGSVGEQPVCCTRAFDPGT